MDDKLHKARDRAARARALIDDELLINGFDQLRQQYIQAWAGTRPDEDRAREILWLAVNAIGKIRDHLHKTIVDGKIADHELNDMIQRQERKKVLGII